MNIILWLSIVLTVMAAFGAGWWMGYRFLAGFYRESEMQCRKALDGWRHSSNLAKECSERSLRHLKLAEEAIAYAKDVRKQRADEVVG